MITKGDIVETYFKLKQRGSEYIFSKLTSSFNARINSTFSIKQSQSSNYWNIAEVKERWNIMITGNKGEEYANYVAKKHFNNSSGLKMLSLACGAGSHEIKFAQYHNFSEITGIDLVANLIDEANAKAKASNFANLHYQTGDIYNMRFPENYYDVILFHSGLHHFKNLDNLLGKILKSTLKKNGIIVIHEYVGPNRISWTKEQLGETNTILSALPNKYKTRFNLKNIKNKAYRPGKLRMIISDPSEAVESSNILPVLHKHYETVEEVLLGGNIIMPLFKDIAHNFTDGSTETKNILESIFEREDSFLKTHTSDFVFGIYRNI